MLFLSRAYLPPALDLVLTAEADELVAEGQLGTEAAVALPTQRQVDGLARTADDAGDFQDVPPVGQMVEWDRPADQHRPAFPCGQLDEQAAVAALAPQGAMQRDGGQPLPVNRQLLTARKDQHGSAAGRGK